MTTRKRMRSVGVNADRRRRLRARDPDRVSGTRKSDDGRYVKVSWCDGLSYIFDASLLRAEAVLQIQAGEPDAPSREG